MDLAYELPDIPTEDNIYTKLRHRINRIQWLQIATCTFLIVCLIVSTVAVVISLVLLNQINSDENVSESTEITTTGKFVKSLVI